MNKPGKTRGIGLELINIYRTRLVMRIAVLVTVVYFYVTDKASLIFTNSKQLFNQGIGPLHIIWIAIMAAMVPKFFPQKGNSMGCRKQFQSAFEPSNQSFTKLEVDNWFRLENKAAKKVFALWFGANAVIALFYYLKTIGEPELVLLSLIYLVCDMICILFWCPFQYFIMKNRCCVTCRIFNWDSIMVCTPLLFVPSYFSWSLTAVAIFLLMGWEYSYWKHPLRFYEGSNVNLQCRNCTEKICLVNKTFNMEHMHSR
jgi:hypothetical protein